MLRLLRMGMAQPKSKYSQRLTSGYVPPKTMYTQDCGMSLSDLKNLIDGCMASTSAEKRYQLRLNVVRIDYPGVERRFVVTDVKIEGNNILLMTQMEF